MKASVKELVKSNSGRKYLERERKKSGTDLLQPDNPKFKRVYGAKIERDRKTREFQEQQSRDGRVYLKEKKEFRERKVGERLSR